MSFQDNICFEINTKAGNECFSIVSNKKSNNNVDNVCFTINTNVIKKENLIPHNEWVNLPNNVKFMGVHVAGDKLIATGVVTNGGIVISPLNIYEFFIQTDLLTGKTYYEYYYTEQVTPHINPPVYFDKWYYYGFISSDNIYPKDFVLNRNWYDDFTYDKMYNTVTPNSLIFQGLNFIEFLNGDEGIESIPFSVGGASFIGYDENFIAPTQYRPARTVSHIHNTFRYGTNTGTRLMYCGSGWLYNGKMYIKDTNSLTVSQMLFSMPYAIIMRRWSQTGSSLNVGVGHLVAYGGYAGFGYREVILIGGEAGDTNRNIVTKTTEIATVTREVSPNDRYQTKGTANYYHNGFNPNTIIIMDNRIDEYGYRYYFSRTTVIKTREYQNTLTIYYINYKDDGSVTNGSWKQDSINTGTNIG